MSALAEQHERWTEARARLWPVTRHRRPILELVPPEPPPPPPEPAAEEGWLYAAPAPYDHCESEPAPIRVTGRIIVAQTARKHGITINELLSPRRFKKIVLARHEAMYRCVKETSLSFPQIGRILGGKDHTTVLHGYRRHEQRLREAMNG